jgi:DNA-directed RNA polymerase sigma subunit (sigma70/sigma32)
MENSLDLNDPLSWYLRELTSIQPMTEEEETDQLSRVRGQDAQSEVARRRLIEAKLSLVVAIAERYASPRTYVLDLVEKGNEALILALTTFRENSGSSFTTHAVACIENAIAKAECEAKSPSE